MDPVPAEPLTRARAFALAWPMFFANAAVPLAAVVDTAVIGAVGGKSELGGVALGGTLFNIFYWSFYFLRMSSTGLAAQAGGGGQRAELQRILIRAVGLSAVLGLISIVFRHPFAAAGFSVLQGGPQVEEAGTTYFLLRSWGAPGAYASFAITGWLIGVGRTRAVLVSQLVYSAVNILLDLWFVLGLDLGVAGVAAATAIADTVGAIVAGIAAWRLIRGQGGFVAGLFERASLWSRDAIGRLMLMNSDMMIRSWAMLAGFTWFANVGAREGAATLAGNHVLLQIVTVWAFVLDAYAYTAESVVGMAIGSGSREALHRGVRITTELALASGLVFLVLTLAFGPPLLRLWIVDPDTLATATRFLPYCAAIPFIGAAAWQLDGIFVGAMASAEMRNASIAALLLYLGADRVLTPLIGGHGMWLAFVFYYVARAGTLAVQYRRILSVFERPPAPA